MRNIYSHTDYHDTKLLNVGLSFSGLADGANLVAPASGFVPGYDSGISQYKNVNPFLFKVSASDTEANYFDSKITFGTGLTGTNTTSLDGKITKDVITNDGAILHDSLGGLPGTDPHTQYILVDGTRAFTGMQDMGDNILSGVATPFTAQDAGNKDYIDTRQVSELLDLSNELFFYEDFVGDTLNHTWNTSPPFFFEQERIDGIDILKDDAQIAMAGEDIPFVLQINDIVVIGGRTWKVMDPGPIHSGTAIAAYIAHIRPV